ncbi:Signal transduction histidine kinase [Caloranaerobacter azorensis DSM 13643]|uniref:histidine kinase n=1 Tax=Caloranaerobacter azorensis DSM 13643 TaxID=1121264 RepID=A0A1M5W1Z4_9FIRM|nr:HAMP domain-containing sensor histidine kinase [Caloranaerobacter azorensis]SHH81244.1 Signal transduction histidine kinase [Caloranaerobacter azorensis DSM 13643]
MGKMVDVDDISLKKQLIIYILAVIILSFICTTVVITANLILMSRGIILRADYYESKVPFIEKYIENTGDKLLNKGFKTELEKIIPVQGIEYQVLNYKGEMIYGNYKTDIVDLPFKSIDKRDKIVVGYFNAEVIEFIPISKNGLAVGMVLLKYHIKPSARNPKYNFLVQYLEQIVVISPFVFIILFTIIFVSKFNKKLSGPLNELLEGANKIKNRNLEFKISYKSNNELGKLCSAFEDMRNELKVTLENQWKLEQDRRYMLEAIAHDLRTPLTIIKGHIEGILYSNKFDEDKFIRYLNLIDKNVDRIIKLIEKMDRIVKLEQQDFKLEFEKCDIVKFLNEKSSDFDRICSLKKINFIMKKDEKLADKFIISTDINALSQILDNIISNSLRYTPINGEIILKVNIEKNTLCFLIDDTGCGFSSRDIKNMFKRFYQGDESRSKEKGHYGLGLYIVKTLVEKLGGSITAGNNEMGGARVKFSIPIQ